MPEYQDIFYEVPDGLRLYARDYAGPNPDAPVVLCMHGLTRNSADFGELAPLLAQTHRIIAVDQRGRGRSDYDPEVQRYNPQTYVADMKCLLDQLGISSVTAIGTSMGGLMAMIMSALYPGLLSRVVMNDIGPVVSQRGLDRINGYVGGSTDFQTWQDAVAYNQSINGVALPDLDDQQWLAFTRQLCREENGRPVLAYDPDISRPIRESQSAAVPPDLWPLFDSMAGLPLMVIRGQTSDILETDCVEEMRRRRPDLVYLEVAGVGHAPLLNEPGVAAQISAFINPDG